MICVTSVTVSPSSVTLKAGNWYYGAYATVCPTSATCKSVRWYSGNTSVATVNASSGYIYAKAAGTARIYASATDGSGKIGYMTVTVTSGSIRVSSVSLSRGSLSLEKGNSYTLTATVFPTNATNKTLTWTSSNNAVATVSSGKITAKGAGYASIRATAVDGSGACDCCDVYVTEKVLVSSVEVSPSNCTMTVGDSRFLYETVCPSNAANKCVLWSSSNPAIATVNSTSGLVYAKAAGSVKIYATAQDGSGKRGTCSVTVNAKVPVTGVTVCPTNLLMNIGDVEYLTATVCPSNATNKAVTWVSSNECVATVNSSGKVTAKAVGETIITAISRDSGHTASLKLTVIIDSVVIQKDNTYPDREDYKIVFTKTGKVWYCINQDIIHYDLDDGNRYSNVRSNHNYYTYYDESYPARSDTTVRQYTDDEIKLLYAIDPHGVAGYVSRYAGEIYHNVPDVTAYKDKIFKLIFKREPRYFARTSYGTWYEISDKSGSSDMVSESELLFGVHPIYDTKAILDLAGFAIDIASLIFSREFFIYAKDKAKTIARCISNILKVSERILSIGEAVVTQDLVSYATNSVVQEAFDSMKLEWAFNIVSVCNSFNDVVDTFTSKPDYQPDYQKEIMNYSAKDTGYRVYIELKNGQMYALDTICDALR